MSSAKESLTIRRDTEAHLFLVCACLEAVRSALFCCRTSPQTWMVPRSLQHTIQSSTCDPWTGCPISLTLGRSSRSSLSSSADWDVDHRSRQTRSTPQMTASPTPRLSSTCSPPVRTSQTRKMDPLSEEETMYLPSVVEAKQDRGC